ncbi:hypothetical protein caldi_09180 [Caldinitratiruptor microaerophilus]|uniref:Spore germination protein n=2 Tax=Caldinitratiruptor microaerophilus TaxID=671077 RepID=A0AA35CK24_9FIRM|nr:hypothetical protein caldi_09180 [Caldinitratiruptor microaerophilus]
MVAVLAGVTAWLAGLVVAGLSRRFAPVSVFRYAGVLVGPWLGKALGGAIVLTALVNAPVDLRVAVQALFGVFYQQTPPWVVVIISAVGALALVWWGPVRLARLQPLLLGIVGAVTMLQVPFLWQRSEWRLLLPVRFEDVAVGSRAFLAALGTFRLPLMLAWVVALLEEPHRALELYTKGFWLGWLLVFPMVAFPVAIFGPEGARELNNPFPYVLSIIRLPNFPVEKVDYLARLTYSLTALVVVALFYHMVAAGVGELTRTRRDRPVLALAAAASVLLTVWMLPDEPGERLSRAVLVATLALETGFVVLWALGRLRRPSPATLRRSTDGG